MVYLDNAATTIPHPEVLRESQEYYTSCFGNPSSVHPPGSSDLQLVGHARKIFSQIFHVPQAGIIFCGSGTESDNLAIKGVIHPLSKRALPKIVTSPLEHAAVTKTCEWLENNGMARVELVNIDSKTGQVDLRHLTQLVDPTTALVSIQHVNSETGTIQDLASISKCIREKNPDTLVHSDGVQAFTRMPVDLTELGVDLYSISSHKFHGLKGAGALIMKRHLKLTPLIHGGGQEHDFRSGTENVVGIFAMARAAELAVSSLEENRSKVSQFASAFRSVLKQSFPKCRLYQAENSLPHIISASFPGIPGEVLLHHLAERGIFVSTGSACNATSKKLSPVLQAVGYSKERIMETVRISIAASEIPEDERSFFDLFCKALTDLQALIGK